MGRGRDYARLDHGKADSARTDQNVAIDGASEAGAHGSACGEAVGVVAEGLLDLHAEYPEQELHQSSAELRGGTSEE